VQGTSGRAAEVKAADVDGMKAVDILDGSIASITFRASMCFGSATARGCVDIIVGVEAADLRQKLALDERIREHELCSAESELTRFLRFVAHVDLGCGIVSDAVPRRVQVRTEALDVGDDFRFDAARYLFPVII